MKGEGTLRLARNGKIGSASADDARSMHELPVCPAVKGGERRRIMVESIAQVVGQAFEFLHRESRKQQ